MSKWATKKTTPPEINQQQQGNSLGHIRMYMHTRNTVSVCACACMCVVDIFSLWILAVWEVLLLGALLTVFFGKVKWLAGCSWTGKKKHLLHISHVTCNSLLRHWMGCRCCHYSYCLVYALSHKAVSMRSIINGCVSCKGLTAFFSSLPLGWSSAIQWTI